MPRTRLAPGTEPHFCCAGCEVVWKILHECHLDDYYRLRDELGDERPSPAKVSGKSFDYFDDPGYLTRFAEPRTGGALRVELYLDGVHCAACSWLVEKALLRQAGVRYAQLHLGRSAVEIVFSPREVPLSRIA